VVNTMSNVGIGREVEDKIVACNRAYERRYVEQIANHNLQRATLRLVQKLASPGAEVVEDSDRVAIR
jgi:hypothetical protein